MIKLRPLSNRVVIVPDAPDEMSKGGIHIPDTIKHIPQMGTVTAVGPGFLPPEPMLLRSFEPSDDVYHRMPMAVKEGDRVFFAKNAGTRIDIERDTYILLREPDVLAVVEEKKEQEKRKYYPHPDSHP